VSMHVKKAIARDARCLQRKTAALHQDDKFMHFETIWQRIKGLI